MKELTTENFRESVMGEGTYLVDFWAPWCAPCKMMLPLLGQLEAQYEGKVEFVKINADEAEAQMMEHGIRSIPTLLFIKDGEILHRLTGAQTRSAVAAKIDEHLIG